ncbi:MAG TPA: DUF177 domain-containing protein [Egibacteraceae bacterium]|nr:DUF177 domain-containing protein [Egibacteraceae bacterium]
MMTKNHDSVLSVTDLLDRPGASRRVDVAMGVPDGLVLPLVTVHNPLRLAGVIESVVQGLLVRGTVEAVLSMSCARCLTTVEQTVCAGVTELFSDPTVPGHPDEDLEVDAGYEICEGTIDLDTLLRDAVVPAAPYQPLCNFDCRGLCPSCGVNRNDVDCDCADRERDPRWAALEGLRLPPDAAGA